MRYLLFAVPLAVFAGGTGVPPVLARTGVPPVPPAGAQDFVYMGDKGPVLMRFHVTIDGKPLGRAWEEFIGRVFAYLDGNGDGVLSREEASHAPPVAALFNNGFPGQGPNIADSMDRDRDGKITREELADWYRRNGAAPFQFQAGGDLPQTQFVAVMAAQPLSANALNEKLFVLLDTDKDGKLSRAELARAPDILSRLDLDDDETVSTAEVNGDVGGNPANGFVVAYVPQPATNGAPFVMVSSERGGKRLGRELLARYAPKGKRSAVRKLSRDDLGLDEATFARLDADEDGWLDAEELARFADRAPDLEFRVRLGKKGDGEAAVEQVGPTAKAVRAGSDDTLLLEFGSTQIQLGRGDASGDPPFVERVRQQYFAQFRAADRDNNGYLDQTEAQQNPLFRNAFRLMDRDGDGKLFEKEVIAYLDRMKELQAGAMTSCASLGVKDQGRGLFDLADANGDGRLSLRELRQMVRLVDPLDRDGDGRVGKDEIPHKYRVEVRRGPAAGNQLAPRAVAVRKIGTTEPELPERASGPRWFRKMDRNHDGDVSRREFLGTDADFRRIDADGDGLISAEEADRADRVFRKEGTKPKREGEAAGWSVGPSPSAASFRGWDSAPSSTTSPRNSGWPAW